MADLLYIHSDAGDGSTEFVDLSGNNIDLTANGDVKHSTAQAKFGATSIYCDGSDDYITCPSPIIPSTDPFTVDFWFHPTALVTSSMTLVAQYASSTTGRFLVLINTDTGTLRLFYNGTVVESSVAFTALNTWYHVAVVRETASGDVKGYVDGNLVVTFASMGAITQAENLWLFGRDYTTRNSPTGYIDEFRIRNEAVWTANFTPPRTSYISKDTYRDLVMANSPCNYWRLGEASGNAIDERGEHDLTWTGTPVYEATGALVNDADTAMTLDGATEYANKAVTNYRSGDQQGAIEFWFSSAHGSATGAHAVSSMDTAGATNFLVVGLYSGLVQIVVNNGSATVLRTDATFNDSTWHHACITSSGTAYSIYVDGVLQDCTGTSNGLWFNDITSRDNIAVGAALYSSTGNYFPGSIDEVAVYDYPLSPQQIWRHYIEGSHLKAAGTRYEHRIIMSKPVNYWRLDETAGPTATDLMGEHDLTWA